MNTLSKIIVFCFATSCIGCAAVDGPYKSALKAHTSHKQPVLQESASNNALVKTPATEIYSIYDQVNGFDIETAELGAVKGHNPLVRKLAVMVLRDHSAVRQMARYIAADEGVSYLIDEKNAAASEHRSKLLKLKNLTGAAFDEAYLRHEENFHESAISAIETTMLVKSGSEEFKQHLNTVLPGFNHHLAETKRMMAELGYK